MNRTNFRPRTVDPLKSLHIFHDIDEVYKKEDNSSLIQLKDSFGDYKTDPKNILEYEIKKIIDLFDKKKSIIIPKIEKFEKPLQSMPAQSNGEGKFTTRNVSYKQSEFIRPKNYIVYSEKNRLESKVKDYEATVVDLNFLKFENFFLSVEELEKIISALENDINKGEMIPVERVKEIILSIIPDKKQHVDKIYKYWYTRREDFKKSLLRKFWKDQKFTDKFLSTTFRRREREKMKTRRNKKNEFEGLEKLKEIKETTQKYLVNLLSMMKEREIAKRNLIGLQQIEFEVELNTLKNEKINLEGKWKDFSKTVTKQVKPNSFYSPERKEEKKAESDKENNHFKAKETIKEQIIATEKNDSSFIADHQKKPITKRIKPKDKEKEKEIPIKISTPTIQEIKPKKINSTTKHDEYFLKYRVRYDKYNNLVIDRYIQMPNSTLAFDDDFNKIISKLKLYKDDFVLKKKNKMNFDNLYENFLKGRYNGIIESDSDEETSNFNAQIKTFSSSFRHFLKHKKSYTES